MRIPLLTTGGTIASVPTAGTGVVAAGSDALIAGARQSWRGPRIEHREILRTGSYALTIAQAWTIARAAVSAANEPDVAGVVVTHGTDTMEETAYLTGLLHAGAPPIVFCGAQLPACDPASDGPANLHDALRLAASPEARHTGVSVAMAGRAFAARDAVKAHTRDLSAFAARNGDALARVDEHGVTVSMRPPRPASLSTITHLEERVSLITLALGEDNRLLRAAADGARGVVVQAFGLGNAPPPVTETIGGIVADGIPVVVASRCAHGPVFPCYGAGGGHDLAAAGAWFAGDLAASKARILLMAVLAATDDLAQAARLFAEHAAPLPEGAFQ